MDSRVCSLGFLSILLLFGLVASILDDGGSQSQSEETTIKEALSRLEENRSVEINEMREVSLNGLDPPIRRMDDSLSTLSKCEKLSISVNAIEKIEHLDGLKKLKILSLGRNNIKSLTGLKAVGDTLTELWISYNSIEKLKYMDVLKKLRVLYMSNNNVKDWSELTKLAELPRLEDLLMVGNPLEEKHSAAGDWRDLIIKRLPNLKKLDGVPMVRHVEEDVYL